MLLKNIEIYQFRNYSHTKIEFNESVNFFIGKNGTGKTNIIEAVFLLLTGEYLRSKEIETIIQFNQNQSFIYGTLNKNEIDQNIRITLSKHLKKKEHWIDQKKVLPSFLFNQHPVITFTPEHLNAIKSGSEERRSLIDQAILNLVPHHYRTFKEYRKILNHRNKILKSFLENSINETTAKDLLESINPIFFLLGSKIVILRLEFINKIKPIIDFILKSFFKNTPFNIFNIKYLISKNEIQNITEQEVYSKLLNRSEELRAAEYHCGYSLIGPHRHEIEFFLNDLNARTYCSQGQQRLLILAFKMAQIMYHKKLVELEQPLLILDDVLSELDEERQQQFINFLQELSTQIFMTSTHIEEKLIFQFKNIKIFQVNYGGIEEGF